jgi:O-antigen ligase
MKSDSEILQLINSPRALFSGGLLMLAFTLSIYMQNYNDYIHAPALLLIILSGLLGLFPLLKKGLTLPCQPLVILVLSFWSLTALNLTISSVPYTSMLSFCIFSALPLTFFAIILAPEREKIIKATGILLCFCLAILSIWGIFQYYIAGSSYGHRGTGPMLNPNHMAALLNLGLLPSLAFFLHSKKTRAIILSLALATLFFCALLSTESRSGILSFLIALLCLSAASAKTAHALPVKSAFLFGMGFLIFLFMYATNVHSELGPRILGLTQILGHSDQTLNMRMLSWQSALELAQAHFWTGTGFGTFYLYYPSHMPIDDRSTGFWVHMDPLQFWVELGILAPLIFYSILVCILIYTLKAHKHAPLDSHLKPYIWGSFCALLTMAIQAHVSYNFYVMGLLIPTALMLALWYHFTSKILGTGFVRIDKKSFTFLTLSFALGFASLVALTSASIAAGSYYLGKAKIEKQKMNLAGFYENIALSEKWAPVSYIDPEIALAKNNISVLRQLINGQVGFDKKALSRNTLSLLDEVDRWNPVFALTPALRAELYHLAGESLPDDKQGDPEALWKESLRRNPRLFDAYRGLGEYYISRGRVNDAYALFKTALKYPRDNKLQDTYYKSRIIQLETLIKQVNNMLIQKALEQNQPDQINTEK